MRVIKTLYLEDDPDDADLFKSALRHKDRRYYTEITSDANAAMHLARTTPFDLIVADITLQKAPHGDAFIDSLVDSDFQTPVAVLTNHQESVLAPGLRHLINEHRVTFLSKSALNTDELPQIIENIISRRISILHVDEDQQFAKSTVDTLKEATPPLFRTHSVPSPEHAEHLLDQHLHYDALITDTEFSHVEEKSLLKLLRKAADEPHLRTSIILLTNRDPDYLPDELRACLKRKSILHCKKKQANASTLANAILAQRANRRAPDLAPKA